MSISCKLVQKKHPMKKDEPANTATAPIELESAMELLFLCLKPDLSNASNI
ncbi:hypothetical protein [Bacteroides heparinolyticus]|uniref:hypothetical protein n=1 Tax=Prevotella heparinolytica TaxID=28113 RepID=UPI0023F4F9F4|nr:hypothetical protein [Bacteroides heparinolyticus]